MPRRSLTLGLFFLTTLGLLFILGREIGAFGGSTGTRYVVRLQHAAGLVSDNAVRIAGVRVGRVEKIEVEHRVAKLSLRLNPEIVLHEDAVAIVRAKSLLGEKYLQLDPGESDSPILEGGGEIQRVQSTFEVDQLFNALEGVVGGEGSAMEGLAPLIARLDALIAEWSGAEGEPPLASREEMRASVQDLRALVASLRRTAETVEGELGPLLERSNRLLSDPRLNRITADLETVADASARHLPGMLDSGEKALANAEKISGELSAVEGEALVRAISDLGDSAASLRRLSDSMSDSAGDLGPLLSSLRVLADRAAAIDELALRRFLQAEGIRVKMGTSSAAKRRIQALESKE